MKITFIVIVIVLIIIYFLFFSAPCGCEEPMENIDKQDVQPNVQANVQYTNIDEISPELPKIVNGRVNINDLSPCQVPIKIEFAPNTNYMVNNGKQIIQDIIKPEMQTVIIDNDNNINHLQQISWSKSNLSWFNEAIPLEIRLTLTNYSLNKTTHMIFPLVLVDTVPLDKNESFTNTFFGLDQGRLPTNEIPNIENIKSGDSLNIKNNDLANMITIFKRATDELKPIIVDLLKDESTHKRINTFLEKNNQNINAIITKYPNLAKDIPNINLPEIKEKLNTFVQKLPSVDLEKLDMKQIINKDVNLDALNIALKKINFNEISSQLNNQQISLKDIHSFLNLDKLVTNKADVPTYKCCSPNIGKVVTIDLCPIATKITNQEKLYITSGNDGSTILIAKPQPYNKEIGEYILENLTEPANLF